MNQLVACLTKLGLEKVKTSGNTGKIFLQTNTELFWLHKKGDFFSPFEKGFENKVGAFVTTVPGVRW